MPKRTPPADVSRRGFLKTSAAAAVAGSLAAPVVHAAGGDTLKVALIGDVFEDQAKASLKGLKTKFADKVDVAPDHVFTGFDGYKSAIEAADVVVLGTSPGFRPIHFAYAVDKGKHVFMEKPHATDAVGARSVI